MDSYDVLVIILSVALAVFLLLAIIFTVYLIKIAKHVNHIAEKAHTVADNVESAAKIFRRSAGPVAATKIFANIIDSFNSRRKDK